MLTCSHAAATCRDDTIANGIEECEVMVCLWSSTYTQSKWCVREVGLADTRKKPIVPLHRSVSATWPCGKPCGTGAACRL